MDAVAPTSIPSTHLMPMDTLFDGTKPLNGEP